MRFIALASTAMALALAPYAPGAEPGLTAPAVTVGRNLQTYTSVKLPQAAPEPGIHLTVTSDDPSRLLLAMAPDKAGSTTLSLTARPHAMESPEFFLQGLADSGTVTYTVSAEGVGSVKGTVTLAASAIVILGPDKIAKIPTTPHGLPARITIVSAVLDSARKIAGEQQVAGGHALTVTLANSNPGVGKLDPSRLTIDGGSSSASTSFQPTGEGEAVITPVQPDGFAAPVELAKVTVVASKPGLAVTGEIYLGKDLQTQGILCLGEAAPPGGLKVTLTSSDASKLLLSTKDNEVGTGAITLNIPAGQLTATYVIQGLGDSGEVTYQAVATGFRTRTARVGLTKSGIIVAYERYGPPDEAAVLQKNGAKEAREFYASLAESKEHAVHVVVWSAYLDPASGLAADMTVQPIRAGVTATVDVKSSNPDVGTVESPLVIRSGVDHVPSRFVPVGKGKTVITITTPAGFTTPKNATSVPATVSD